MNAPNATLVNAALVLEHARELFQLESAAVSALSERADEHFVRAVACIVACQGRVVVTGLGKSGAIGRKIASTFASTGTPALFLHAGESLHGDLGMIAPGDVLLAISYSGRTPELAAMLPVAREMGVPILALTGNLDGYLAHHADVVVNARVEREACPLNLAPTTSTTVALALGDALAICAMRARGFSSDQFARFHPGGALGQASKLRVSDLMRTSERLAVVPQTATLRDALEAITRAGAGAVLATNENGKLCGYLTDGDARRAVLHASDANALLSGHVAPLLTRNPLAFAPQMPAVEALRALQERNFGDAPVVNESGEPVGILDVQELLRAGLA